MQAFEIIAIVAIVVAVAAGAGLALVYRRLQRYQRNQHVIMGSRGTVDIVEHVAAVDDKLTNVRVALEDLTLAARDHDVRIDGTLSRVGIVRFDAYHDLGGRQSTAVAFLNSLGDGVVITTVVSRDFARMYVKLLKDGAPTSPWRPRRTRPWSRPAAAAPSPSGPGSKAPSDSRVGRDTGVLTRRRRTRPWPPGLPGRRPQTSARWPERTAGASARACPWWRARWSRPPRAGRNPRPRRRPARAWPSSSSRSRKPPGAGYRRWGRVRRLPGETEDDREL